MPESFFRNPLDPFRMTGYGSYMNTENLRPAGMNDEQTECDACGRMELRGTVIVVDGDANEVGRYGTTCASRILGVKWSRAQVCTVEASRRQAVVHIIHAARRAEKAGNSAEVAMHVQELDKFHVLHRDDEKAARNALVEALPNHWKVIF